MLAWRRLAASHFIWQLEEVGLTEFPSPKAKPKRHRIRSSVSRMVSGKEGNPSPGSAVPGSRKKCFVLTGTLRQTERVPVPLVPHSFAEAQGGTVGGCWVGTGEQEGGGWAVGGPATEN